jgi:HEAT repeat protein
MPSLLAVSLIVAALAVGLSRQVAGAAGSARYAPDEVAALLEVALAENLPEARRAQAVRDLANTEVRTQMSALRRLLREERSTDIRLSAACTLAALGDRKAPRDLLLVTAYEGSRTPTCSRSDVVLALAAIGDPAAVLHLERALRSPPPSDEPAFHRDVLRALGRLNTREARALLLQTLRDGTPELRSACVTVLTAAAGGLPQKEREPIRAAIVRAAASDPDDGVGEQAASALFWSGLDGAAFYRQLEGHPRPEVRLRAVRAMGRHRLTPQRAARLRAALARERDPRVRAGIEKALAGNAGGAGSAA